MGEANQVHGVLRRFDDAQGELTLGPIRLSVPHYGIADGEVDVAIRPEAIAIRPVGTTALRGVVRKAAYLGGVIEYNIESDIGVLFVIDRNVEHPLAVGTEVALALAAHGVIAIPTN
jgi:iron(III) transport system ATP-binding protein